MNLISARMMLLAALLAACDEAKEKEVKLEFSIENKCTLPPLPVDSVIVQMHFVDKDKKPVVDADVSKRVKLSDGKMSAKLRLKDSDQ
jgi:hypothetical protein